MPKRSRGPYLAWIGKRKLWYVRVNENGGRRELSTGTSDRGEAEAFLGEYLNERRENTRSGPPTAENVTIADCLADYLEECGRQQSQPKSVASRIGKLLRFWGRDTVACVSTRRCKDYGRWSNVQDSTLRRELVILRAALNYAVQESRLDRAPYVRLPKAPAGRDRWLTRNEAARLLWECRKARSDTRPYLTLYVRLALYTGARPGAVMGLRWPQIRWLEGEGGVIDFNPPRAKKSNKRRARVPMAARIASMELYGIVSMIDDTHFGGENAFRTQYAGAATPASQEMLRERLSPICHRTLRRQVQEAGHINFRQRHAVTFKFEPYDQETTLYEMLSAYLQDTDTIAYGGRTNALVVLQARKSLGSSTRAVASYLDTLLQRLRSKQRASPDMTDDFEDTFDEERETLEDDDADGGEEPPIDPIKLAEEIALVESMRDLAQSIGINAKGEKLVHNLPGVLDEIKAKGGKRKAVIFTESVRTQKYLNQLLTDNGYAGQIVLMNGSNNDDESKAVYAEWKARHAGTDRISGSKTADMKAAIVEAFKSDEMTILIATESGAEGINLQFCSLLINYDLPWNPQRVEQRIGRCHRYGQLVDVTVVNMLNMKNRAEARIHELLEHKLHLFDGVFGSSDEVLGILTDGIDFEKEVLRIMQKVRSDEQADREFDELTARIQDSISADLEAARAKVLENMDADVVAKLHRRNKKLANIVPDFKQRLLMLAKAELPYAVFPQPDSEDFAWDGKQWTTKWPLADENDWQFFRANEGLGSELIERAKARAMSDGAEAVTFDPSAYPYPGQLGGVVELAGQSGWLRAFKAIMPTPGAEREEVIVVGETDAGEMVPPPVGDKMMLAPALSLGQAGAIPVTRLSQLQGFEFGHFSERMKQENYQWLIEEDERLNRYARDMEIEIESQIAALDAELKDLQRQKLSPSLSMEEKVALKRFATSSALAPLSRKCLKAEHSSAGFIATRWKFSARLASADPASSSSTST